MLIKLGLTELILSEKLVSEFQSRDTCLISAVATLYNNNNNRLAISDFE